MTDKQRPLALVTGASSGIGYELARRFAMHKFDLVLCAEDVEIESTADELLTYGGEVWAVRQDLRTPDGVEKLYETATRGGRHVEVAALNAGIGYGGPFVENDLARELDIIDLNVRSTVHLAKLLLRDMVRRNDGKILITSSIASMMPGSFQAVYNASKSFLQSFTEALQNELKDTGVTLTALMPGPTETNFFHRAEMDDTRIGQSDRKDDPGEVAQQGFDALMDGRPRIVAASKMTKAQAMASRVTPDAVKAQMHRFLAAPASERR